MLYVIVGETGSGKDTIARYLDMKYNIPMVVSYTTRPKREGETDGVQHYFISPEEMHKLTEKGGLLAYTKFPKTGYEYCATEDCLKDRDMSYILNPDGVSWLKKHSDFNEFKVIGVSLSKEERIKRAKARGDEVSAITARIDSEQEQFDTFFKSKGYDYLVDNSGDHDDLYLQIDKIMFECGVFAVQDT